MGSFRNANYCTATLSPTILFCVVIVLLYTIIPIQLIAAVSSSQSRSLFVPGKYLAYQQTIKLSSSSIDYQLYNANIPDLTTISMSIDGSFGTNTSVYMYVSPTDIDDCATSFCHYPGTWFVLPIDEALRSDPYIHDYNWTGAHFRSAFATLNQAKGTPPYYGRYPPTFTIDFIVPLDTFTNTNTTDTIKWTFVTSIRPLNPTLYSTFSLTQSGSYKDMNFSSSRFRKPEWYYYTGFSSRLKALSQGETAATLDLDIMAHQKDDFSISSFIAFNLLEISASHKLFYASSPTFCSYSASSSIRKAFWEVTLNSGLFDVNTWVLDDWPRRLSISCPNSAYYTTPGWFYVWQNDTMTRVENPTQAFSSWPVVGSFSDGAFGVAASDQQNNQLATLQTDTDPILPQTTTQFASSALIYNTQTFFAISSVSSNTAHNVFEASSRVDNTGSDGMSVGAIIGIVVGAIAGVVLLVLLIVLCCLCCRSASKSDSHKPKKSNSVQMGLAQPHQAVQVASYTTATAPPMQMQGQPQPQPDYQNQYYAQNQAPYHYNPQNQQYQPQQPQQGYGHQPQPQYQPQQPQQPQQQPQPQYDPQPQPKEELPPAYGE